MRPDGNENARRAREWLLICARRWKRWSSPAKGSRAARLGLRARVRCYRPHAAPCMGARGGRCCQGSEVT